MAKKTIWGTLDPFVEGGNILGRKVANKSFLDALLFSDPFDEYHFFLGSSDALNTLKKYLVDKFPGISERSGFRFFLRAWLPQKLSEYNYHCLHLSDPFQRHVAASLMRNKYSERIFPVTSVTHSLSYQEFIAGFLAHAWEGVSKRDAIIGTSQSARLVLEESFATLSSSYGENVCKYIPSFPIIPLGVDAFPGQPSEKVVEKVREKLSMGEDLGLVFLSLSRISTHSKMDFLPVLLAFKRAENQGLTPGSYTVVLAGWVNEGDSLPDAFISMADHLGIRLRVLRRPTAEERDALYDIADVFLSPSDNVQETFGLTVVEAGAAGLPSIVSDFNGYKDTVLDGITGLRVPTLGFSTSEETNSLAKIWFDNQYHFKLAQQTVIDVPLMAEALVTLAKNTTLREQMGKAASEHVKKNYHWEGVIKQYCNLWDELWSTPINAEEKVRLRKANHPLRMDFARIFQDHFSQTLTDELEESTSVIRTKLGEAYYQGTFKDFPYAGLDLVLDKNILHQLLFIARKPISMKRLLDRLVDVQKALYEKFEATSTIQSSLSLMKERANFTLLWSLKHDLLEKTNESNE